MDELQAPRKLLSSQTRWGTEEDSHQPLPPLAHTCISVHTCIHARAHNRNKKQVHLECIGWASRMA